jgi:hypothetical protein
MTEHITEHIEHIWQSLELQLKELDKFPPKWALKTLTAAQTQKSPYTSGDYVRWQLNRIFGPHRGSHKVLSFDHVETGERFGFGRAVVRLQTTFADGTEVVHEDIGITPLRAKSGADLANTPPEPFEMADKGAVTDGLKGCAEHLGLCFRPLSDTALEARIRAGLKQKAEATTGENSDATQPDPSAVQSQPAAPPPNAPATPTTPTPPPPAPVSSPPGGGEEQTDRQMWESLAGATNQTTGPTKTGDPPACPNCGRDWRHANPACQDHHDPKAQAKAQAPAPDKPRLQPKTAHEFWAEAYSRKVPRDDALSIIARHTTDGRTDWTAAFQELPPAQ